MRQALRPFRLAAVGQVLERFQFIAFILGCGLLFWQQDAAPVDWLFVAGIVASVLIWKQGAPAFDLGGPQALLLVFLCITALATMLAGGMPRFFAITVYLAFASLALASMLKRDVRRIRTIEAALVVAGVVAAITVFAGGIAEHVDLPILKVFAYDSLRAKGLFKDSNIAGAFIACSYPVAAAYCLRLRRWRSLFLSVATALFAVGVIFTYSRLALFLFVLGVVASMVALAVSRRWRPLLALCACALLAGTGVAGAVAMDRFPLYRYQFVQSYDETGRFEGWRVGAAMLLQTPLGTGAGSFESRSTEQFQAEHEQQYAGERSATDSDNLLRNGAGDGLEGWIYDPNAFSVTPISDPTSVTGFAIHKHTTGSYQDLVEGIPVVGGHTYSFAAQIRSDGAPALLIIHWRDANEVTVAQSGNEPAVTSTLWTEAEVDGVTAPDDATTAYVFLSNREAGDQYFTAVRMVEGDKAPAWSPDMQWRRPTEPPVEGISAHETYLRLAVESGIPGILTLGAYWVVLAWSAWRRRGASWQWPVALTLVLIAGLVIDSLHWRFLWVFTAVAAAAFTDSPVAEALTRREAPVAVPAATMAALTE